MNLDDALAAHASWKVKFRTAIDKREQLDAGAIGRDNGCELGKWLHGPAKGQVGLLPEYSACVKEHAVFHVEAGKVAQAINSGRYEEATDMIAAGTPYDRASSTVGASIVRLRKVAKL